MDAYSLITLNAKALLSLGASDGNVLESLQFNDSDARLSLIERNADPELFRLLEQVLCYDSDLWSEKSLLRDVVLVDFRDPLRQSMEAVSEYEKVLEPGYEFRMLLPDKTVRTYVRLRRQCTIGDSLYVFVNKAFADALDKKIKRSYFLTTVKVAELLESQHEQDRAGEPESGNGALLADLSSFTTAYTVDSHEDNAMFHQFEQVLRKKDTDWTSDSLKKHLVFLDFKGVFLSQAEKESAKAEKRERLLQRLFTDGLLISFDDEPAPLLFLPFDKSASMARTGRISFVSASVKEEMDRRLLLDLDFRGSGIRVSLSKLYAYRGLYFSDASRIEQTDSLILNPERVIVIADPIQNVQTEKLKLFGDADPDETRKSAEANKDDLSRMLWKLGTYSSDEVETKPFDGEGFISLRYAQEINKQLPPHYGRRQRATPIGSSHVREVNRKLGGDDKGYIKAASSFQVRMPFTKGVLHAVDFHGFFTEYLNLPKKEPLWIEDAFGIPRDLRKAEIILTQSMFKCCRWLDRILKKKYPEGHAYDPMQYYFRKLREFDHTLYVGNTDAILSNSSEIKMNYQFLNTLDMEEKEFKQLIRNHLAKRNNVIDDLISSPRRASETSGEEGENDDIASREKNDDMSGDERLTTGRGAPWLRALSMNRSFSEDPKIHGLVKGIRNSLLADCGIGRLVVPGECRFLSGDLSALLLHIVRSIHKGQNTPGEKLNKNDLQNAYRGHGIFPEDDNKATGLTLYEDKFYMPDDLIEIRKRKNVKSRYYGLLRNPHLSRNEQCALLPYLPAEDSIYGKYFSHLSGVVMVSRNSLVPMILSGADFDGDLVKIVADGRIVNAIKNGAYQPAEKEKPSNSFEPAEKEKPSNSFERKLPVIVIPDATQYKNDDDCDSGTIPFKTVKNTFDNQIGLISNMAIHLGKREARGVYFKTPDGTPDDNISTPACTVITGLEIDAAKTGIHPRQNIQRIRNAIGKGDDRSFLDAKERILKMPRYGMKVESKRTGFVIRRSSAKSRTAYLSIKVPGSGAANLDLLPWSYAETKLAEQEEAAKADRSSTSPVLFDFQQSGAEQDPRMDEDLTKRLRKLIEAYCGVLGIATRVYKAQQKFKNAKYRNCICHLLKLQYDSMTDRLPESGIPIEEALDEAYAFLDGWFRNNRNGEPEESVQQMKNALKRLLEKKWQLTPEDIRKETARDILGLSADKEAEYPTLPGFYELISNFGCCGFKLFYFLLKDVISQDFQDMTPEMLSAHDDKAAEKKERLDKNEFFKTLYRIYSFSVGAKETKAIWHPRLINQCRSFLADLFRDAGKDLDEAVMYCFQLRTVDRDARFFWDVLQPAAILKHAVSEKPNPSKGDEGHAE